MQSLQNNDFLVHQNHRDWPPKPKVCPKKKSSKTFFEKNIFSWLEKMFWKFSQTQGFWWFYYGIPYRGRPESTFRYFPETGYLFTRQRKCIFLFLFALKTSLRERTRRVGNPTYPVFISTPPELGDILAGTWPGRDFWTHFKKIYTPGIPMENIHTPILAPSPWFDGNSWFSRVFYGFGAVYCREYLVHDRCRHHGRKFPGESIYHS